MANIEQPEQTGVTRRTVTKAMAWAVPAVAIATAAPLTAASPVCLDSGVCFGGADRRTAYITLSDKGQLGVMQWPTPGLKLNF